MGEALNVVFRYTSGPSAGLGYRTTYRTEEELKAAISDLGNKEVVVAGIDDELAVQICDRLLRSDNLVSRAIQRATGPDGHICDAILKMELMYASTAIDSVTE